MMSSPSPSSYNTPIIEYAKSTQKVCMCLAISVFVIILFMMTPLKSFIFSHRRKLKIPAEGLNFSPPQSSPI